MSTGIKSAVIALSLISPLAAFSAQDTGELWQITTSMEMEGMPMAMPQQTSKACLPKDRKSDAAIPKDESCTTTDHRKSGNKTSYKIVCQGKNKMTGTGEFEDLGSDGYRGKTRLTGTMDGEKMDMTQKFSGKRIGTCKYEEPAAVVKKYQEQADKQKQMSCKQSIDELNAYIFTMKDSPCLAQKPEFCKRVSALSQEMREPDGYEAAIRKHSNWQELMRACNLDPAAVTNTACKRATDTRKWEFVAAQCAAESKVLAKKNCEGRDYTEAMESEFAPICRRYAAASLNQSGSSKAKAGKAGSVPGTTEAGKKESAPSATDVVKDEAKKLRKLLPF